VANGFKLIRVTNIEDFTILVERGAIQISSKTPLAVLPIFTMNRLVEWSISKTKTAS
jgi:hypothetical protein